MITETITIDDEIKLVKTDETIVITTFPNSEFKLHIQIMGNQARKDLIEALRRLEPPSCDCEC